MSQATIKTDLKLVHCQTFEAFHGIIAGWSSESQTQFGKNNTSQLKHVWDADLRHSPLNKTDNSAATIWSINVRASDRRLQVFSLGRIS